MTDWARRRPLVVDSLLALVLTALGSLSLHAFHNSEMLGPLADFNVALAHSLNAAVLVPMAVRRRFPLSVLVVSGSIFAVYQMMHIPDVGAVSVGLYVAMYSAGAHGRSQRRTLVRAVVGGTLFALLIWTVLFDEEWAGTNPTLLIGLYTVAVNVFYLASAWVMGDFSRDRLRREAQLLERADELELSRAENARRAVIDERVRLARELHDVVAHHVSVMGVQAGAARRVLGTRPEAAEQVLASIEASSRQAVAEMHGLLGLLRQEGDDETLAPTPTLAQAAALVEQFERESGLEVVVATEGEERPLPPGVDLSAYRIVQEALTNTRKHGGPSAHATVTFRYRPSLLEVEIVDDGRGPGPSDMTGNGDSHGHGLIGMRERVALHGGQLRTGRRTGGGYEVRARFPLPNP
ncbi:sensor histidine kinase [soil metagenome]